LFPQAFIEIFILVLQCRHLFINVWKIFIDIPLISFRQWRTGWMADPWGTNLQNARELVLNLNKRSS